MAHQKADPNQESMLTVIHHDGRELALLPRDFDKSLPPEEFVGPAVDMSERADHMVNALRALGSVRKLVGFGKANQLSYRQDFEARYGNELKGLLIGASDKAQSEYERAQREFNHAYGYYPLRHSGLVTDEVLEQDATHQFNVFVQKYGSSDSRKVRDTDRRRIERNERNRLKAESKL